MRGRAIRLGIAAAALAAVLAIVASSLATAKGTPKAAGKLVTAAGWARPTILALAGLKDDYTLDGRVLVEGVDSHVVSHALRGSAIKPLMDAYEQVNASFGEFALSTLKASTAALRSSDDAKYTSIEDQITSLTAQRDALVAQIRSALNAPRSTARRSARARRRPGRAR